jgi:hypothetical protein
MTYLRAQNVRLRETHDLQPMDTELWKEAHRSFNGWRAGWALKPTGFFIWLVVSIACYCVWRNGGKLAAVFDPTEPTVLVYGIRSVLIVVSVFCLMFADSALEVVAERHCRDAYCVGFQTGLQAGARRALEVPAKDAGETDSLIHKAHLNSIT